MKILNYLRIKFHPLLYLKSFKSIRNILNKLDFIYYKKSKKITTYKLNELLNYNFSNINLIKIDVEGGEVDVIEGGINLIEKHSPMIIVETDELNLKKINEILAKFGYQYKLIDEEASNFLFFNNQKFKSNVNN